MKSISTRLVLAALLGAGAAPRALALKLEEVPGLVGAQNQDVAATRHDLEAARAAHSAAYAPLFPKVELKSTYTRLNDDIVLDIEPKRIERDILGGALTVGIEVDPPPVTVQEKNIYNAHLLATQPLYAGGRITAGLDAAAAAEDDAALQVERAKEERTVEALARYGQAVLAARVIEVMERMLGELERLQGLANSLVSTGMAAKFSTLQLGVAKAELQARLEEARGKAKLADLAFKSATGLHMTETVTYESPLKLVPLTPGLDVFKTQAVERRREFAMLDAKGRQVDALRSARTGDMLPTVYAFGKRELIPEELTLLQPLWAVGVGIDIPLTAGIKSFPERRQAQEMAAKIATLRVKAQREIPLQVESFYAATAAQRAQIDALAAGREQASEATRLAEVRFKSGAGSSMELLKAQSDLETLEVKRLVALEEYNRKLLELYQASGAAEDYLTAYKAAPVLGDQP
jgi:outer membrane protein TolC